MKIRSRISIIFSILTSLVLIVFGATIYLLESYHQTVDFQNRLKDRIEITENFFLEKENFSETEFVKIRKQFLHTLPDETVEVIKLKDNTVPNFKLKNLKPIEDQVLSLNSYSFELKKIQGESKQFRVKGESYLIIVTAIDTIGKENLSFLLVSIILIILLAIPLIFTISFIITRRALLPLSKKIEHANNISAANLSQRLKVINPNDEIGQMATAFNKLLDRLEVSFDAQKSFISNASHEMRNPLTAIIGETEVALSRERTCKEYQITLDAILDGAESLNSTMTNLLQLSKINANEMGVKYDSLDMNNLLSEIKSSYDYINPINKIVLNIPVKELTIKGNKNLLKTAITNILDNACKYSSNQTVLLNLTENKESIKLEVIDTGIGIPENEIQRIKEPFYRAKNTFKFNGSGIGLALSSKIIILHGGSLIINSKKQKGTSVIINIPQI